MYKEFSVALKKLGISKVVSPINKLQLLKAFHLYCHGSSLGSLSMNSANSEEPFWV